MAIPNDQVQELQGLYGPFTIAERVVQKIWLRRDFTAPLAVLTDGRKLVVRSPGTWNLLGGPDFRGARLLIEGREITGDIEVHFHVSDWRAHSHESDPAYGNVVLHVVMFPPPDRERMARRCDGVEIPTLVLLPILHRSLEEYASDDALENITERDATERIAELMRIPAGELWLMLRQKAAERWALKKHFAALRIEKLGWTTAMHQTALEILGYRRNRAAMLTLATNHPLEKWERGLEVDEVFAERAGQWELQGVRPANHPRLRLMQYQRWVEGRPGWPETLRQLVLASDTPRRGAPPLFIEGNQTHAAAVPSLKRGARQGGVCRGITQNKAATQHDLTGHSIATPTTQFRKQAGMPGLREKMAAHVLANALGGTRLDTLVCDGFLPMVSVATGHELLPLWFHWYLGDVPLQVRRALRETGIAGQTASPLCHGWGQGLLGWLLEHDLRASG